MARFLLSLVFASLLALAAVHETQAIEYIVENRALNTAGGVRFRDELGVDYTKQRMRDATDFIWNLFKETTAAERRDTPRISLFVEDIEGIAVSSSDIIHFSAKYIEGLTAAKLKNDFNGILYHEITHSLQRNGKGQAPVGLVEGIADFVSFLKAGFIYDGYANPGDGNRWDEGYGVTARFLEYCNGLKDGFVAELNKKMIDGYSNDFFNQLLGKTVDQLWTDYKAKYAN
ncbi:hypothetical protein RchiOBHm_Chr6g0244521 [Rosa chinensis]|uniref:Plant basic secretory protein (BSP) family protein n=1 Tax=Rosa chinensis TaxID=74649 RepID=A0A2P6PJ10_ROSCH|nr:uncharacterized protein LOC112174111 [Rosa chinensis]PRQ21915.1 hypothetical protein RchiOBHm_Chr6g0244521 [Rosa chinensis]